MPYSFFYLKLFYDLPYCLSQVFLASILHNCHLYLIVEKAVDWEHRKDDCSHTAFHHVVAHDGLYGED